MTQTSPSLSFIAALGATNQVPVGPRLLYPTHLPPAGLQRGDEGPTARAWWKVGEEPILPSAAASSPSAHRMPLPSSRWSRGGTASKDYLIQSIRVRGGGGGVGFRGAIGRSSVPGPKARRLRRSDREAPSNRRPDDRWRAAIQRWYGLPQASRYFVSGNLGNVVFFMLEKAIHRFVHEQSDLVPAFVPVSHHTLSFLVAYMAQVVPQHLLHALLVYGIRTIDTPAKYLKTLAGTYSAFAMSMVGSTVLNSVLVKFWSKDAAFVSTIVVFATVNYFFITWVVRITARQ